MLCAPEQVSMHGTSGVSRCQKMQERALLAGTMVNTHSRLKKLLQIHGIELRRLKEDKNGKLLNE